MREAMEAAAKRTTVEAGLAAGPQRLKPDSKQCTYCSAEALLHPRYIVTTGAGSNYRGTTDLLL